MGTVNCEEYVWMHLVLCKSVVSRMLHGCIYKVKWSTTFLVDKDSAMVKPFTSSLYFNKVSETQGSSPR